MATEEIIFLLKEDIQRRICSMVFIVFINVIYCTSLSAYNIQYQDSALTGNQVKLITFYQQGKVFQTNKFVSGTNLQHKPIDSFRAVSVQLCRQTKGDKLWEQLYNFPRYGIGFFAMQFIDTSEPGQPIALYGTLSIPLHRWNRWSLNTDLSFGLTFNWNTYQENKYNLAMGGSITNYADAGLYLEYNFRNGLFINGGASLNHFSNGAMKMPNLGINTLAPRISLGYNFAGDTRDFKRQVIPVFKSRNEVTVSFYSAWECKPYKLSENDSISDILGITYNSYGLSGMYNRQISYKSRIGVGLMVDYLGSAGTTIIEKDGQYISDNTSFADGLEVSVFPSWELVINKLSVVVQAGFYLYRTEYPYQPPDFYQRVGLKYNFISDLSFGIYVRAQEFTIADFMEWTLTYRFHRIH